MMASPNSVPALDQRGTAPEFQRLTQGGGGCSRIGAHLGLARGGQPLEADDVGVRRVEGELVAGRAGVDHRLRQRAA
jgi:hypothetical protein